jgi:hypothetical protein
MWLLSQLVRWATSVFEHSIWDCVGFYRIHTFLDPSVESQFRIISKSHNFLFGTTTITFSNSHFFSGKSWHTSSPSIVLYLWLGARRPTAQSYDPVVSPGTTWGDPCILLGETLPPITLHVKLNGQSAVSMRRPTISQHPLEKQVTSSRTLQEPEFFCSQVTWFSRDPSCYSTGFCVPCLQGSHLQKQYHQRTTLRT